MKKLLSFFLMGLLVSGLVQKGGSDIVYPVLDQYMEQVSKTCPPLYEQLCHQKNLHSAFCGLKSVVKSKAPEGVASTNDRMGNGSGYTALDLNSIVPPIDSSKFCVQVFEKIPQSCFRQIFTPPPKLV